MTPAAPAGPRFLGKPLLILTSPDPVTGSNWEGVGVRPDEPVDAERAEAAAYRKALELLIKRTTDADTLDELRDALGRANASASSAGQSRDAPLLS